MPQRVSLTTKWHSRGQGFDPPRLQSHVGHQPLLSVESGSVSRFLSPFGQLEYPQPALVHAEVGKAVGDAQVQPLVEPVPVVFSSVL